MRLYCRSINTHFSFQSKNYEYVVIAYTTNSSLFLHCRNGNSGAYRTYSYLHKFQHDILEAKRSTRER